MELFLYNFAKKKEQVEHIPEFLARVNILRNTELDMH